LNKLRLLEILTGLLMGLWIGGALEYCFVVLYNLFCRWQMCALIPVFSWKLLMFPLLVGIFMANAIPQLPLSDY